MGFFNRAKPTQENVKAVREHFTCCGMSFQGRGALDAHKREAHAAPRAPQALACECGASFSTQEALGAHARQHQA